MRNLFWAHNALDGVKRYGGHRVFTLVVAETRNPIDRTRGKDSTARH